LHKDTGTPTTRLFRSRDQQPPLVRSDDGARIFLCAGARAHAAL